MSLSDYLAKNYLSDNKKKTKKPKKEKKEKTPDIVRDQDQPFLKHDNEHMILDAPSAESVTAARPLKSKGWKVVGTDEVLPEIEIKEQEQQAEQRMSSGAKAGLQNAEEVASQIREKEESEKRYLRENSAQNLGKDARTVHRDSSGKIIDLDQRRAEARESQIKEEERKRQEHIRRNMGLVQLLDLEENRERLRKIGDSTLATYADDEELNSRLKAKEHDDDPLLSFNPTSSKKNISRTGRKLYKDGYPENRFGIVPGWRWDGVDRSNGFEKKWFKKQAEVSERKTLSYTMQEDY